LGTFDAVLREVFGSIQPGDTRRAESVLPIAGPKTPASPAAGVVQPASSRSDAGAEKLPWVTRSVAAKDSTDLGARPTVQLPDVLPSRFAALADQPFDQFDKDDLRLLGAWLEAALRRWPRRRTLRFEPSRHGKRID